MRGALRILTDCPFATPFRIGDIVDIYSEDDECYHVKRQQDNDTYYIIKNTSGVFEFIHSAVCIGDVIEVLQANSYGSIWHRGYVGKITTINRGPDGEVTEFQLNSTSGGWLSVSGFGIEWMVLSDSGGVDQSSRDIKIEQNNFTFEVELSRESILRNLIESNVPIVDPKRLDKLVDLLYNDKDTLNRALNEFLFDEEYGYITQIYSEL